MQIAVYNMAGQTTGEVEVRDDIFGVPEKRALVHQAVVQQLANRRLGTSATKTRGEVSGGGRKPWRQKGTGRARQGSTRAPQWRGGGVVFGPHPRSYRQAMPRKARRLALKSALSARVAEKRLVVLDQLSFEEPDTKQMSALLNRLAEGASALVVTPGPDANISRSARNLPEVKAVPVQSINIVDVLKYDYLVMPLETVRKMEEWWGQPTGAPAADGGGLGYAPV